MSCEDRNLENSGWLTIVVRSFKQLMCSLTVEPCLSVLGNTITYTYTSRWFGAGIWFLMWFPHGFSGLYVALVKSSEPVFKGKGNLLLQVQSSELANQEQSHDLSAWTYTCIPIKSLWIYQESWWYPEVVTATNRTPTPLCLTLVSFPHLSAFLVGNSFCLLQLCQTLCSMPCLFLLL